MTTRPELPPPAAGTSLPPAARRPRSRRGSGPRPPRPGSRLAPAGSVDRGGPRRTLRASGLDEVAALVPYQLGFVPHSSLVAVATSGRDVTERGTTRFVTEGIARLDLPRTPDDVDDLCRALAVCLGPVDPDDVLLLVYAEDQAPLGAGPRRPDEPLAPDELVLDLADALATTLGGIGIGILDALLVEDGRTLRLGCAGQGCCSALGTPLPLAPDVPAVAELVGAGAAPARSRDDVARSVAAGSDDRAGDVAALLPRTRAVQARRPVRDRTVLRRWRETVLAPAAARAIDPRAAVTPPDPATIARMVAELETDDRGSAARPPRSLRDAVITWCDPDDGSLATLPADVAVAAHDALGPCVPKDDVELSAVVDRLAELVRCVPADACAGVSGVLAAVAWRAGDVVRARAAADQALAAEPGHTVARLVLSALDHGVPPSRR